MSVVREIFILWRNGEIPCLFHLFTGLYCPGCGGTRAVKALLLGRPLVSFLYHPLVLFCALLALWFAWSYFLYRRTGKERYRPSFDNKYVYAAAILTAVNFIIKNVLLIFSGIDLLALLPKV